MGWLILMVILLQWNARSLIANVWTATTVGSDHYPVLCTVGGRTEVRKEGRIPKWIFEKADWDKFQKLSEETVTRIDMSGSIEDANRQVTSAIIRAAEEAIPKGKNKGNQKLVPWWNEECHQAVRTRNKAFRIVKRTHNLQNLIQYKKAQAVVRRTIRQAKRSSWRNFFNEIGRTTSVGEVWGMIKRMGGDRRQWEYPVLTFEEEIAVSDREKVEVMVKSFTKVHSSENLLEEERRRRATTLRQYLFR